MPPDNDQVTLPKATADVYQRSAALLDKLLGTPDTALEAERLIKRVNPEAKFERSEIAALYTKPIQDELATTREELAALKKQAEEERAARAEHDREAKLMERLTKAQRKHGFDEATMTKVMERMREQNNPDVEAAAAFIAESVPKPAPVAGNNTFPGTLDVYGTQSKSEEFKGFHDNWRTAFDGEVRKILADSSLA